MGTGSVKLNQIEEFDFLPHHRGMVYLRSSNNETLYYASWLSGDCRKVFY